MCTGIRFVDARGNMYFARNLDWHEGYGEQVVVTPAGANVPAAFERPHDVAPGRGHAVIGVGIVAGGVPLYFDCGNDAGLAVAGLNFPQSARYAESPAEGRANVAAYEFPLWVARNFATAAEAREALADVTIVARPVSDRFPVAKLHWLIADAAESIVVECLADGIPHVWDDDVDALANEPEFGWHRQNLRNYLLVSGEDPACSAWGDASLAPFGTGAGAQGIPGDYCSPSRFVRAAFANAHYPDQNGEDANVLRAFRTLGAVAVPMGCAGSARDSGGALAYERTLYTSCYSAATRTYYRATYDDPSIGAFPLDACDLARTEPFVWGA